MEWKSEKTVSNSDYGITFFMTNGYEVYFGNLTREEAHALKSKYLEGMAFEIEDKPLSTWTSRENDLYVVNPVHVTHVRVKKYNF